MTKDYAESNVLIVGAGPVGLTLALDLAWRGIAVTVIEARHAGEPPSVKCNHISARSMEIFRRLGVAKALRDTGLPADYPNDCAYRTSFTGTEFARIPIPARKDRYTATGGPDTWWPTPEPPHRVNQIYMEPVMFSHAAAQENITILNRTRLESLGQDDTGAWARARNLDTGEEINLKARYIVGCDGSKSLARKSIGARLQGASVVQRTQSTYFRAPDLYDRAGQTPAWMTLCHNPRRTGTVVAIDGRETFLVHNYLLDEEPGFGSVDRDRSLRDILGVGPDFEYEILSNEDWIGRRLVADKFRDRRIFICGDAAHLWVPYAGYGMNAGIADATNLSWQIAAVLKGWADAAILDAYEAERLPITEQVSYFAMNFAGAINKKRRQVSPLIEDDGPEGERFRAEYGKQLYDLNVQQYCCGGLNFGYFYDGSGIISYDDRAHPAYTMYDFEQTTVPGCRVPHVWLDDGRSLYDALGPDYTLIRLDPSISVDGIVEAAGQRGVPLAVLDIPADGNDAYDRKLVLARPDQHVAWSADAEPAEPAALIDTIRGAAPTASPAGGQRTSQNALVEG